MNALRGGHTHMHTDIADKSNFKKLGTYLPLAGMSGLKIICMMYYLLNYYSKLASS